ncbi:polymorphic toxin type 50 domain-containing protein [Paraburkholderia xenovorans]
MGWIDPLGLTCISTEIHEGAQGKHIPGHNNYTQGKSILNSDAQALLDRYHAGNVVTSRPINDNKVRVNFGDEIGTHIDPSDVSTRHFGA